MTRDDRFPRSWRLLRPAEFRQVYARRRSVADPLLVVHGRENDLGHARLGLAVSKRVGGAVVRNRWKRLLREAFRQSDWRHKLSIDLIVTPRSAPPPLATVQESLTRLARQLPGRLRRPSK